MSVDVAANELLRPGSCDSFPKFCLDSRGGSGLAVWVIVTVSGGPGFAAGAPGCAATYFFTPRLWRSLPVTLVRSLPAGWYQPASRIAHSPQLSFNSHDCSGTASQVTAMASLKLDPFFKVHSVSTRAHVSGQTQNRN